ncbi:alpha-L-glutamate ligase, RimK family [Thermanaerovibrio velox DSM 12556]|uniref:Alpha-L-glutamate ligase, RimK family n=1 Tax=Thermanaerovibrio velox DSM 12556 TaxID=926567 RepID=H0UNY1_9BACT|nr:alpha-L-glutamate ligase, RimK family [Thermanaerovibrio velox DSM 12556]
MVLYTRLRVEEKLLHQRALEMGIRSRLLDVSEWVLGGELPLEAGSVPLCRCISHGQNEMLARCLNAAGVRVSNPPEVMALCGNKMLTALELQRFGIPQPRWRVALSQEGAMGAVEELGYPAVLKPLCGSWGRLLAKVNDREALEAVVEHKQQLGVNHQTFFIQEYVEKGGFDVRAFIIGGEPVCAVRRESQSWITNTARGGRTSNQPVDSAMRDLLKGVHGAIGGDFLAVDLFLVNGEWMVNEVNDGGEFKNSLEPTGVDIPGLIVRNLLDKQGGIVK